MIDEAVRCYLYRFFDADGRLLYVGIARDLGARFSDHRRRSAWWADAVRGTTTVYPSRDDAGLAEAIAIVGERPMHNTARPTEARVEKLAQRTELHAHDVPQLVAEIERLRELVGAQTIRLAKMRGSVDAARAAYRSMRAKYLEVDAVAEGWKRKFFVAVAPSRRAVEAAAVPPGDWGDR